MGIFDRIFGKPQLKIVDALMNRAGYAMVNSSFWDAVNYFDIIVKLDPTHSPAWVGRGIAFEKLEYYLDAYESFSKAESLGNTTGTSNKNRLDQRLIDPTKRPKIAAATPGMFVSPYEGDTRGYFYISERW